MLDNISITPDALEFEHANYQRLAKRLNFPFYIKDDYVYWIRPSHKHYEENHEANYVESVLWNKIIENYNLEYLETTTEEVKYSLPIISPGIVFANLGECLLGRGSGLVDCEIVSAETIYKIHSSPFIRTGYYYSPKESDPNFESIKNKLLFGKDISEFSEEEIKILKRDQKPFGID